MGVKKIGLDVNFPDRQPNEPDATEKQKGYIRTFDFGISEKDIQKLGKWQASNVIDQLQDLRDEGVLGVNASKTVKQLRKLQDNNEKSGNGCISTVVIVLAIVLIVLYFVLKEANLLEL
jgi:hypothetical protein